MKRTRHNIKPPPPGFLPSGEKYRQLVAKAFAQVQTYSQVAHDLEQLVSLREAELAFNKEFNLGDPVQRPVGTPEQECIPPEVMKRAVKLKAGAIREANLLLPGFWMHNDAIRAEVERLTGLAICGDQEQRQRAMAFLQDALLPRGVSFDHNQYAKPHRPLGSCAQYYRVYKDVVETREVWRHLDCDIAEFRDGFPKLDKTASKFLKLCTGPRAAPDRATREILASCVGKAAATIEGYMLEFARDYPTFHKERKAAAREWAKRLGQAVAQAIRADPKSYAK